MFVGEGHSSNRSTGNLQECPSKALAPHSDFFLPYHTMQKSLGGWCRWYRGDAGWAHAPLPYEIRSLGYPRSRKNGGHNGMVRRSRRRRGGAPVRAVFL